MEEVAEKIDKLEKSEEERLKKKSENITQNKKLILEA